MFAHQRHIRSIIVFCAFFIALFMMFTPFEAGKSMLPKYVTTLTCLLALAPVATFRGVSVRGPSVYLCVVALLLALHTIFVRPTPGQFTALVLATIGVALLLYGVSQRWPAEFEAALAAVLIVQIVMIFLQMALFYAGSATILDFHKMLYGSASRVAADYLHVRRFAGLQVEPGTYAHYIACLLGLYFIVARPGRMVGLIGIAGMFSILVTNAAVAIYFVAVVGGLFLVLHRESVSRTGAIVVAGLVVAYLFYSGYYEHLLLRFVGHDDGSLALRTEGVDSWLALSLEDKYIGVGLDVDPCNECHYQDIGTLFNLFTRGGALVVFASGLLFLRAARKNGLLFFLLAMALLSGEKMFLYEAPVWLFVLYAVNPIPRRIVRLPRLVRSRYPRPARAAYAPWIGRTPGSSPAR